LVLSLIIPHNVNASENFTVDANVEYKIQTKGKATVTNTITIRNITSDYYGKSYVFYLNGINPKNLKAYEEGKPLSTFSQSEKENTLAVTLEFPKAVAGKGKSRTFIVTYEEDSLAEKTGDVWEISIPKLEDAQVFREYNVFVSVPKEFGGEAYIWPEQRQFSQKDDRNVYFFQKEDMAKSGITAAFGQFQTFSFTINYHLDNPSNKKTDLSLAIPPDTSLQRLFYNSIDPEPKNIVVDEDGNWLAIYILSPKQKLDVKITGSVQIFAKVRKLLSPSPTSLLANMKPTSFWQSDDPVIREIAKAHKTPREIYNYVTATLTYNYERVTPDVTRFGAKLALSNPKDALCMEFTDLFIALARANGIPAREINGYAYSDNPKIQPLSLVADVLHSWPEYWDETQENFVPVDPTWGATSGIDYFNKFDLKHFTFVIHGKDPVAPSSPGSYKLGENTQKDIFVTIGDLPEEKASELEIQVDYPKSFEFLANTLEITFSNTGKVAIYDIVPQIFFDEETVQSFYIGVMPPKSNFKTTVDMPIGFLGRSAPSTVKITAYRTTKNVLPRKNQAIIYQLTALIFVLTFLVLYINVKVLKHKIISIQKIVNITKKIHVKRKPKTQDHPFLP